METEQTPPVPEIKVRWSTSFERAWLLTIAVLSLLIFSLKKAFNKKNRKQSRILFGLIAVAVVCFIGFTLWVVMAWAGVEAFKYSSWFNLKQSYILSRLKKTSN